MANLSILTTNVAQAGHGETAILTVPRTTNTVNIDEKFKIAFIKMCCR